ncbi:DUF917 domain-containing protein [Sphingosinicella microcystinivorans]|uniref:DUF917 domain-containing protein n=1 Tax=Sphingosinicella microcystinivorans TaxID=335406 RepID=UPI0022F3CB9B|nr:DUF917 domain-containing protein [Sphingosinicella microcystinivorans]WBX85603.1 DUF917 domain-containing protein [Sphingosinicella microcystinivorans]
MLTVDTVQDIQDIARGAVVLGTGGGGDPYVGELFLRAQIAQGRFAKVITSDEVADDAFVLSIAGIGAPSVMVENLVSEIMLQKLLKRCEEYYGRSVDALISAEIGGINSMFPLALSAISGIPVVDADGVGRAIPRIEMTNFSIDGCKATPAVLMDESGNIVMIEAVDDRTAEDICRVVTGVLGAAVFGALYPMTGKEMKACAVHRTLTQAFGIGRCIRESRESSGEIFANLIDYLNSWDDRLATILFDGKIVDVSHETRDGWHWGKVVLNGLSDSSDEFTVEIQNEFIVARHNGRTVTVVPDLISILDRESGEPLTGEMLTYGQRVKVLGYAADPILRRPESLEVLGPRAFGLSEDFSAIETLVSAPA